MTQCKAEQYGPSGEHPVQCEVEEGHTGLHRAEDSGPKGGTALLWPIEGRPAQEVIVNAMASLLEGSAGLEKWSDTDLAELQRAFEVVGRPRSAEKVKEFRALVAQKKVTTL